MEYVESVAHVPKPKPRYSSRTPRPDRLEADTPTADLVSPVLLKDMLVTPTNKHVLTYDLTYLSAHVASSLSGDLAVEIFSYLNEEVFKFVYWFQSSAETIVIIPVNKLIKLP
ncbi:hypothetical protein J6590_106965 [Homalodisca vitripennis]|nr:hypothetical protein J6590_106965 [Homalodisca vitripennis]